MASLRCPRCGAMVEVDGKQPHCPACNFPYRDSRRVTENAATRTTTTDLPPLGELQRGRPLGVTVIGALDVLVGVAILAHRLVLARALLPMLATNPLLVQLLRASFGSVTVALGAFAIVQGIGVLRGDRWASTLPLPLPLRSAPPHLPPR